jgi:hypothetical protein
VEGGGERGEAAREGRGRDEGGSLKAGNLGEEREDEWYKGGEAGEGGEGGG